MHVQWGDMPLQHQLYNWFLSQIKDEISRVGNLTNLHILAQSIEACYWECRNESPKKHPQTRHRTSPMIRGGLLLFQPTRTPVIKICPAPVPPGMLPPLLLQPVLWSQPLHQHPSLGKMVNSLRKRDSVAWTMFCASSVASLVTLPTIIQRLLPWKHALQQWVQLQTTTPPPWSQKIRQQPSSSSTRPGLHWPYQCYYRATSLRGRRCWQSHNDRLLKDRS